MYICIWHEYSKPYAFKIYLLSKLTKRKKLHKIQLQFRIILAVFSSSGNKRNMKEREGEKRESDKNITLI